MVINLNNRGKKQQGFSLLEVLIGLTLLSFLMISVYAIIDNNTKSKDKITSEDRRTIEVEMALARIETDFSQIYSPLYYTGKFQKKGSGNDQENWPEAGSGASTNPDGTPQVEPPSFNPSERFPIQNEYYVPVPIVQQDGLTITFMTFGNKRKIQDAKESQYNWVRYSITDKIPDGSNITPNSEAPYILTRQSKSENIYDPNFRWDEIRTQVLLKNIKSAEFSFWDKKRKKFVSSLDEVEDGKYKITSFKILLKWLDYNNYEQITERSYRVLWPYFDVEAEQKEIKKIYQEAKQQQQTPGSPTGPGSGGSSFPGSDQPPPPPDSGGGI